MTNTLESYHPNLAIEYHMRTDLPVLRSPNTLEIIRKMEKNTIPKNTEEALEIWGALLASKMQYDVINYALIKEFPSDGEPTGWIDKVNPSKLGISPEQMNLMVATLGEYRQRFEQGCFEYTNIDLMILSLKSRNLAQFISIMTEMPSLQQALIRDEKFSKKWMKIYEAKGIPELLQMCIGNCKTLALMSKMILENANSHWNLGIKKIEIIEQQDHHVVLVIHTKNGIIKYDPMAFLYHQDSKVE